jgi:Armadillo/beta-catenin-like repeat
MVSCTQKLLNTAHVCIAGHREALRAAIPLFIDLLKDGDFSVQNATTSALGKLANQGVPHEFPSAVLNERNSGPLCDN